MFVDLLALVVVFGPLAAGALGDGLRGFVGFEAAEELFLAMGGVLVAQSPVAEHQGVVHLDVFGIDARNFAEYRDGASVVALQKEQAADLIQHYAIARVFGAGFPEGLQGAIVVSIGLLNGGVEKPDAAQLGVDGQRLGDKRFGGVGLAFLDEGARHVEPTVGVLGFGLGGLADRVLRALEIALQKQADAPI